MPRRYTSQVRKETRFVESGTKLGGTARGRLGSIDVTSRVSGFRELLVQGSDIMGRA